jgi:hypothetical protein
MKKLILAAALGLFGATAVSAQPSISIGPGGVGVDLDRRDRDRRFREEREVRTTGSTRRCRITIEERENRRGEMVRRRIRECD